MKLYLAVFVSGVVLGILCGWIVTMIFYKIIVYKKIENSN